MSYRGPIERPIARALAGIPCLELVPTRRWAMPLMCLFLLVLGVFCDHVPAQEPAAKNVLVLYGFTKDNLFPELEPMKSSLRAHLGVPVNIYVEYLDSTRFNNPEYRKSLSATISQAYAGSKPDLVIVGLYPALHFALDFRQQMFPEVPIVFVAVDPQRLQGQKTLPAITGVTETADIRGSLDLALGFHPDTQNIAVISGTSEFEGFWLGRFRKEVQLHHGTVNLIEFSGLPTQGILERVSALPRHTIVFAQIISQDSAEPILKTFDLISAVSQRFPTYSIFNYCMDHGCIGGSYPNEEQNGRIAGEMAARILTGGKPENIPIQPGTGNHLVVDWGQLHHWNISEALIPPGTRVLNRPPGIWERSRKYIITAVLVIVVQFALILALLMQRKRKRHTEAVLRESEERFRLAAQAGKMFAYEWDAATDVLQRSPEFVQVLGFDESAETTGRQILAKVHEADREGVMAAFAELSPEKPYLRISFRMVRPDGTTIWVERSGRAQFSKQGKLLRVVGMLADITERKRAEEQLQESEERFRLVATTAPVMIWMSGPDKLCTYFNQPWLTFTGRSIQQELGNGWAEGVHAGDLEHCLEIYTQAFDRREPFEMEYRLRRHDGEYCWIFDYGVPRFNADGSFAGYIGSASDLTDQKLAQEALEKVSGQLIEAQERERRRLAMELHDDICQRLAMLSLKIEKVTKGWSRGQLSVADQLEQIWQQCSNLTGDVQALSHELHPSILDNLGLATAVKSFCREVSEQSGVVVEFVGKNIPDSLPAEVSLSLFRVVQEAVHNAIKYSGEKHFDVRLQRQYEHLELEVRDQGVGFDASTSKNGGGLGLVSMAERIHQVNGTFNIDSQPNAGTRIRARLPLTEQKARAASAS